MVGIELMLWGERWQWRYPASTSKAEDLKRYVCFSGSCIIIPGLTAQISHPGMSWHATSIACNQHQSYLLLGSSFCVAGTMQRIWKLTLAILSAKYFSLRSCRLFSPPNISPMTFMSARNTCSSHLTSAAAMFPTCRHGSPKSLSWTIFSPSRRAGADELKHETSCTWQRRSVEAWLSQWSSCWHNAVGLLRGFLLINTSNKIGPHGLSSAMVNSRSPLSVGLELDEAIEGRIGSLGGSALSIGYSVCSSEQSYDPSSSSCILTRTEPKGDKKLTSPLASAFLKTPQAFGIKLTAFWCLSNQQLWRFTSLTATLPCHEAGFMWSTLYVKSSISFIMACSVSHLGEQSH